MNIYKYIYESGLIASGCWDKFDDYDQKALEKFAELIVQECAEVANKHMTECEDINYGVGNVILRTFGVK